MNTNDSEMLSTQQVAQRFHVSVATVRNFFYSGRLPAYQLPGRKGNFFKLADAEKAFAATPKPKP